MLNGLSLALSGMLEKPLWAKVKAIFAKYGSATESHMYQAGEMVPVLGPELVVDPSFDDASKWGLVQPTAGAVIVNGGNLRVNSADGSFCSALAQVSSSVRVGGVYFYEFEITSVSGAGVRCDLGGVVGATKNTVGVHTGLTVAVSTVAPVIVRVAGSASDSTVSRLSVREILSYTSTLNGFTSGNYGNSSGSSVGVIDQPVGLALDAAGSVGSAIPATNGGWGAEVGAIITEVSPTVVSFNASPAADCYSTSWNTLSMQPHQITFTVSGLTSGGVDVVVGWASAKQWVNTNGTYTHLCNPSGNNVLYAYCQAGTTATVTINSVREITGLHASNGTTAQQPKLRRGIVNLLTYSNDFSNAAWIKENITVSDVTTGTPWGGVARKISETATLSQHSITQSQAWVAGQTYTVAFVAKAAERNVLGIVFPFNAYGAWRYASFNLTTGQRITTDATVTSQAYDLGDGFWLCIASSTAVSSHLTSTVQGKVQTLGTNQAEPHQGDGTSGIYLHSAALFQGTLTASQILAHGGIPLTTTAAASSANGPRYWEFDGVDDNIQTGLLITGDSLITVAARHRVTSPAAIKAVVGAKGAVADRVYICGYGGFHSAFVGTGVLLQSTVLDTQIAVSTLKIVGGTVYFYVNGSLVGQSSIHGTTNPSYGLFFGAINNAGTGFANNAPVDIYSAPIVSASVVDSERTQLEAQAAKAAGGRLVAGAFVSNYQ